MADDNKLLFEFKIDEKTAQKEFEKLQGFGKDTTSKLAGLFQGVTKGGLLGAVASVTLLNQGLELAGKLAEGIGKAISAGINTITVTEKIETLNKQFDILSTNAVGAGNDLRSALQKSADGLVDNEDLLKAANRALVDFKGNASDLPKILETARRISKITGNDILETFESLNQAIATQRTRALQDAGINLKNDEIQKKYAASLGKTVEQLTEFEKRQALTQAILKVNETNLAGISLANENATQSFKKFSVQVGEVGDSLSILSSAVLKPILQPLAKLGTSILEGFNNQIVATFGDGAEKTAAQVAVLESRIQSLTKSLAIQRAGFSDDAKFTELALNNAKAQLKAITDIRDASEDDAKRAAARRGDIPANVQAVLDSYIPDPAEVAKRNAAFQTAFIAAQQANLQLQIADAQLIVDEKAREDQLASLRLGQIELEEQNHKAKLLELERQFQLDKTLTQSQYNELRNQENIRSQLQVEAFEAQSNERKRKQAIEYQQKITSINTAIQQGILKTVSAAAERLGASLVKGGDAFADFQNVVLGIIGDIAIQIGGTLVGIGLGVEAIKASILGLTGGPAIAAGLALIALGGLLKSLSSGGSTASADAGGGGGGGIGTTPSEGGIFTPTEDAAPQKPGQSVTVNVQGNILDRRQTGLELAEVIRESFDQQGTTIVGAV